MFYRISQLLIWKKDFKNGDLCTGDCRNFVDKKLSKNKCFSLEFVDSGDCRPLGCENLGKTFSRNCFNFQNSCRSHKHEVLAIIDVAEVFLDFDNVLFGLGPGSC